MNEHLEPLELITQSDLTALHARHLIGRYDREIRHAFLATRPLWHQAVAAIYATCATLKLPDGRRRWLESHGVGCEHGKNPFLPVVKLLLAGAADPIRKRASAIADAVEIGFDQGISVGEFYDFIDRAIGGTEGLHAFKKGPRGPALLIDQAIPLDTSRETR